MNKYQDLIDSGYEFDFSKYLGDGWDILKKGFWNFVGFSLVLFVISSVLSVMVSGIQMISVFLSIPLNILSSIVQTALFAGIFIFCRNIMTNRQDFSDFFQGLKDFVQIAQYLIVLLLFFVPVVILFITTLFPPDLLPGLLTGDIDAFEISQSMSDHLEDNIGMFILGYFLAIFLIMVIYTLYSFALPLIVNEKMNFWEAMETSRKITSKRLLNFVGLYFIVGLIVIFGSALTCFLGLLVFVPFFYCVVFAAYDNILQPELSAVAEDINDFGTPGRDSNTEQEDDIY